MDFSIKLFFSQIIGPAGTGKTESVKALGHQLGRFVLVFNCDETFDFQVRNFFHMCKVIKFPLSVTVPGQTPSPVLKLQQSPAHMLMPASLPVSKLTVSVCLNWPLPACICVPETGFPCIGQAGLVLTLLLSQQGWQSSLPTLAEIILPSQARALAQSVNYAVALAPR